MADYSSQDGEKKPPMPVPVTGPRPDEGPMSKDEFQSLVDGLISSAAQFIDGELSPQRSLATDYYKGRPFGNEEPGRSQFISTEVRDGVSAVLPGVLKVVFGPDRAVEFTPRTAEDVEAAEQASDFVQYVFSEENNGFLKAHSSIKDGLVRGLGVAKWWWDDTTDVEVHKVENIDREGMEILAADDEVELTRIEQVSKPGEEPLFNVELKRTVADGRARWDVIPPEEFLYNRESRDVETAVAVWHRTRKTRGELIAMKIDPKVIDEHGGDDTAVRDNEEAISRTPNDIGQADEQEAGKANDRHLYCEGFARIDYDGDGIAELRKVCTIGPGHFAVVNEPAAPEDFNFSLFIADPEPHQITGMSWADRLMDLQKYKSMLMRGLSDSLSLSLFPRMAYSPGVSLADLLNTSIGAPIRVQGDPNQLLRVVDQPFKGGEILGVIDLVDAINERRTGQNRGVGQIDADALQSSTPAAVTAAITAAQAQQEILARIYCETFLKPLFKGLLHLLITHQPRKRMVRLRNKWTEIDPRDWNSSMDVQVNVALGSGFVEQKIETLLAVSDKQAEILKELGMENPIVGLKEYRDTLAKIAELRGLKDADRYFKPITKEVLEAMAAAKANQPPEQHPEIMLAQAQIQIQQMKAQADIAHQQLKSQRELAQKQAEMAMEWQKMQQEAALEQAKLKQEDDRERDKNAAEMEMAIREMELKYMSTLNEQKIKQEVDLLRHTVFGEGDASTSAPAVEEEAPAPPKRRTRRVQFHRDNPDDARAITGATIEDDHE